MKKIFPTSLILIAIIIVAIISIIWFVQHQHNKQTESEKVSIRLQWVHQAQFAGYYYADKAGYYKNEDINVTLMPGGINAAAIPLVASGSDQFGVTGADQIILAREKGIPVVAIATIYRKSPFVLFSLKDSNITTPKQFIGKKIGFLLGSEPVYRTLLKNAGVNSRELEEVPVTYDITPFLTKKIDVMPGYAINEVITAEEQGYTLNLIWPSDYGINFYADTLFTTEEMIKNRPDIVRKVVKATIKGWEEALENPEQAVTYTLQYSDKLTREHEMKMMNASIPLVKPDNNPVGSMDRAVWVSMQDLLLEQGVMKQAVDIGKSFTTEFLP